MMLASFPMYRSDDEGYAALWGAIREQLSAEIAEMPEALSDCESLMSHWQEPSLLLSQACGYPLTHGLSNHVQLVGTFHYAVPGCDGIWASSPFIVRADAPYSNIAQCSQWEELAGARFGFNAEDSQSGYWSINHALHACTGKSVHGFFAQTLATGAHAKSIEALCRGEVDIVSLDAVTWQGLQAKNPALAKQCRVLCYSASYPNLPLITSLGTPEKTLHALRDALQVITTDTRYRKICDRLWINGFTPTRMADYQIIRQRALGI